MNDEQNQQKPQTPDPNQFFQPDTSVPVPPTAGYGQYVGPPPKNRKKPILIIGILLLILIIGGVVYALTASSGQQNNQAQQNAEVTVPTEWKIVETEFGFSLKAPQEWESSTSETSTAGNLSLTAFSIGTPESVANDETSDVRLEYVTVGTQTLSTGANQEEFEAAVTNADGSLTAEYKEAGLSEDQIKITSSKIDVQGKQWLQVDTEVDGQLSRVLYFWTGDKAIVLAVVDDETANIDQMTSQYLLPMAASIELR